MWGQEKGERAEKGLVEVNEKSSWLNKEFQMIGMVNLLGKTASLFWPTTH